MPPIQNPLPGRTQNPFSHSTSLSISIKEVARQLGFDHCRIAPAETSLHAAFFEQWLAENRAGEMTYLERHVDKRRNPLLLTPKASSSLRSIIVLAVNYHQFELPATVRDDPGRGIIASYAWSDDYHEVIRPLLYDLDAFIRSRTGRTSTGKCLVDTGPVLERDWAQCSGVGFTGKNCCTIHPTDGSWLFLATVIVPEILDYDPMPQAQTRLDIEEPSPQSVMEGLPSGADYGAWRIAVGTTDAEETARDSFSRRNIRIGSCGQCTRCLDACPTDAFVGPYHLDPLRCISYWTIEAQDPIPHELRPVFRNRIFGCDICQEVCPWNRRLPERTPLQEGLRASQDRVALPLLEGFRPDSPYWLDQDTFHARFRRSPLLRAKRHGMLRNVCVALGNWGSIDAAPALVQTLGDLEPLARGHAAWALGRVAASLRNANLIRRLDAFRANEQVEWVRAEITAALDAYSA